MTAPRLSVRYGESAETHKRDLVALSKAVCDGPFDSIDSALGFGFGDRSRVRHLLDQIALIHSNLLNVVGHLYG